MLQHQLPPAGWEYLYVGDTILRRERPASRGFDSSRMWEMSPTSKSGSPTASFKWVSPRESSYVSREKSYEMRESKQSSKESKKLQRGLSLDKKSSNYDSPDRRLEQRERNFMNKTATNQASTRPTSAGKRSPQLMNYGRDSPSKVVMSCYDDHLYAQYKMNPRPNVGQQRPKTSCRSPKQTMFASTLNEQWAGETKIVIKNNKSSSPKKYYQSREPEYDIRRY